MSKQNFKIVVIGSGMAGLLACIKLKESGYSNLVVYEKADRIGGTWRENTYPGLTCDVPSHHYTYSFARNPQWTRHYSPGAEIQSYFESIVANYALDEFLHFSTEVVRAKFDGGEWHLELSNGETDVAKVVIAATGVLHAISTPKIPGIETFAGDIFHTARWDHSVSLSGKKVGVVGMGSTGVQIISALSAQGVEVSHFVRNPQWIMPIENGYFSEEERALFTQDPQALHEAMDFETYSDGVERYTQALIDPESEGAKFMSQACHDNLAQNVQDPELRGQLQPDHEPLCKRLIFSPDYYQSIQRNCAQLVRSEIECIEPEGIRTQNGELHQLDVIALATGFRADQFMRPMKIVGRNNVDLETLWSGRPQAYLAISMPDFPNFFMLNGPNGPVGNFSLVDIAEHQWAYISQLIDKIQSRECDELCPTYEAMKTFDDARVAAAKKTIWYTGGCQSWYLDAQGIPASWPWTFSRFVAEMREPNWEAFGLELNEV